jgi:uncharacterized protein
MTPQQIETNLEKLATKFFHNLDPAHDMLHTKRVVKNAYRIGEAEGADLRILIAAALLHDIGRAQERQHEGVPHEIWGAKHCVKILKQHTDLSADEINAVATCILEHRSKTSEFSSLESKCLYDADKLDSVGIIGLTRTFSFSGLLHQPFYHESLMLSDDEDEAASRSRVEGDEYSAYDEFKRKLCRVKDGMQTKTGRSLARNRHSTMCHAIDLFRMEIRGDM